MSRGKVISKEYLRDNHGDYPVYSSQTANDGELGRINTYSYDGKYLTWTTDGAYAGTIFRRIGKFNITNVCGLIDIVDPKLNIDFAYYWLSRTAKSYVYDGMGNPKLMTNVMETISIPIPPLVVQAEIVNLLDKFTQLSAELKAELKLRRKQYDYYRNHLLSFDSNSTTVHWMPLGEVAELKAGKSISATQIFETQSALHKYPCFGGNGIRGYVDSFSHHGEFPIIGRQGALCGCVNYANGDFYATEHAVVAKPKGEVLNRFLFYMLQNADLNQYKTQGAQPGLSVTKLNEIVFPIPPMEEQERIVGILDKFETLVNDLSKGLPAEIALVQKQYEYYRNMLLTFE